MPAPKYNENRVLRHRIARIVNQNKLYFKSLDRKIPTHRISENFQRSSEFESLNNRITTNSLAAETTESGGHRLPCGWLGADLRELNQKEPVPTRPRGLLAAGLETVKRLEPKRIKRLLVVLQRQARAHHQPGEPGGALATTKSAPATVVDPDDRAIGDQLLAELRKRKWGDIQRTPSTGTGSCISGSLTTSREKRG